MKNPAEPVGAPLHSEVIQAEVEHLAYDHVLVENERYVVVTAWAGQIPNALYEVGRLRELAFREAGRGTGKRLDLDQFDLYYLHVLVWSKERREIAGACRIGQVDIVLKRYGRDGLYTGRLFAYSPALVRDEGPALEISKAFVRGEYQGQVMPISLLCQGVGQFISRNPHYRNLIGLVSRRRSILNGPRKSKVHNASGVPVHADGKGVPGSLRLGGTVGENPDLAFVDLTETQTGLRYCMGKAGLERFIEYYQPKRDRAA
ncbi:MAG: GNAT family N-acetyltransferase [Syntrophorhabdales bacterium]|jgi:hypothetical protein